MEKELREASSRYNRIILYPLIKPDGVVRWIPDNCEISNVLTGTWHAGNQVLIKNFGLVISIVWTELMKNRHSLFFFRKIRFFLSQVKQVLFRVPVFADDLKNRVNPSWTLHFYSVWMNEGALILSILKKKKQINNSFFRLHGYDLFDERREGKYMPFRAFNFKYATRVFVLSETGVNYLKNKNIYPEKLQVNYSGLYDKGTGPFDPAAVFTIVSCSNILPFKRVEMIAEAISFLDFEVNWIHFGSGEALEKIKTRCATFGPNIHAFLKGRVANSEIIDFYLKNHVNLFLHLSETEGLGMAIVEAQSFGIPAIAVDAGGVREVVSAKTGILVGLDYNALQIAETIASFRSSQKNTAGYRAGVKEEFLQKFEAGHNYHVFFKLLEDSLI